MFSHRPARCPRASTMTVVWRRMETGQKFKILQNQSSYKAEESPTISLNRTLKTPKEVDHCSRLTHRLSSPATRRPKTQKTTQSFINPRMAWMMESMKWSKMRLIWHRRLLTTFNIDRNLIRSTAIVKSPCKRKTMDNLSDSRWCQAILRYHPSCSVITNKLRSVNLWPTWGQAITAVALRATTNFSCRWVEVQVTISWAPCFKAKWTKIIISCRARSRTVARGPKCHFRCCSRRQIAGLPSVRQVALRHGQ